MSIEEVERIMDETQDSIEYQRVGGMLHGVEVRLPRFDSKPVFVSLQQIDEMLAGSLSQEDEDAVLAELDAIIQVTDHAKV